MAMSESNAAEMEIARRSNVVDDYVRIQGTNDHGPSSSGAADPETVGGGGGGGNDSRFRRFCRFSGWQRLLLGLLSASPALLFIGFGSGASFLTVCGYVASLLWINVGAWIFSHHFGVTRWFAGISFVGWASSYKSSRLLANCDNAAMRGALYAVTALWECSNAALLVGGVDLQRRHGLCTSEPRAATGPQDRPPPPIDDLGDVLLHALAPCQVNFVEEESGGSHRGLRCCSRRSVHIAMCSLAIACLYSSGARISPFVPSFVPIELELTVVATSVAVVVFDVPSHLWQLSHDLLSSTPLFASSMAGSKTPRVILPYGWIYTSKSSRDFWSRWSRPAMQLIRYLFFYPLGGRDYWYISIPVTFLLNASTHFDLSNTLVGDMCVGYWMTIFGTLAAVAMLEVAGDRYLTGVDGDGNTVLPPWYLVVRAVLAHSSLRFVLYIMVYKIFKTSLRDLLGYVGNSVSISNNTDGMY